MTATAESAGPQPTSDLTTPTGEPLETVLTRMVGLNAKTAARVMAEYRRFLTLDATMEGKAEPSAPMAQMRGWHQAGAVGPVRVATPAYGHTLERYRALFGAEPPRDIWPSLAQMQKGKRRGKLALYSLGLGAVSLFAGMFSDHWLWALGQLVATLGFFWGLTGWLRGGAISVAPRTTSTPAEDGMERHIHQMMIDNSRQDP